MINPKPLWNFEDPKASAEVFENLRKTASPEDADILQTQIARAHGLQGQFDEGLNLINEIKTTNPEVKAWVEIEHGRLLRSQGNPQAAQPHFERSSELSKEANLEELHIDALHMIALTLPPEEQIEFTKQAIEKAKQSKDQNARNWQASLLNNLGMAFTEIGDWTSALTAFEEALEERRKLSNENQTFIARYMIGWTLRNLNRTDEAKTWMLALQQDLKNAGRSDEYVEAELKLLA